jgi:CheY-like chemotaxis protein
MDDEELMRLIIRKMFEHFGCEVVQSATGEESLALCRQAAESGRPFDLVLLDLWIDGGMGGIDAVGQIRELMPGAVIVAISGDEGNAVMLRADEHQFTTAQAKPFSIDAVEDLILRFF